MKITGNSPHLFSLYLVKVASSILRFTMKVIHKNLGGPLIMARRVYVHKRLAPCLIVSFGLPEGL